MRKKLLSGIIICGCMATAMAGCGSSSLYKDYENAYMAMSKPGSINADIRLSLVTDEDKVDAKGNMKMNQEGAMYYEMEVGDTEVVQFLKDGVLYSDINGVKTTYDIANDKNERPKEEGGKAEKEEGNGFDIPSFLEEFATMIEAGKIKEMGILDPINENVVENITVSEDESGKLYTLKVPDAMVEAMFNTMTGDQVSEEEYALTFSNLENFSCVMHVNQNNVLDGMKYGGTTDITIPEALTGEGDKNISMDIILQVDILNAGTEVEIPVPDTDEF